MNDSELSEPINVTAPEPVSSKKFASQLANLTKYKIVLPIPKFLLRCVFGEGERILTNSQNAFPEKLLQRSFEFEFPDLESCLTEEVISDAVSIRRIAREQKVDGFTNLSNTAKIVPQYGLNTSIEINSNAREVFKFFANPSNLPLTTAAWMNFIIISASDEIKIDTKMDYKINVGVFKLSWTALILKWNPPNAFGGLAGKRAISIMGAFSPDW